MKNRVDDTYWREVINPGDRASKLGHTVCVNSYDNCPAVTVVPHRPTHFRGPVGYVWQDHILEAMLLNRRGGNLTQWQMLEEQGCDGAGGKTQFYSLVGTPEVMHALAWEPITMTADDMARDGRLPCLMANQPDFKRVTDANFHLVEAMFQGYADALAATNLVSIAGETAIMKHQITAFCDQNQANDLILTWSGVCTGLAHRDLLIDPSLIKPGMPVVGFWEPGYRCNGGTYYTETLLAVYGDIQQIRDSAEAMEFVRELTIPSQSYAKYLCWLIGWNQDGSIDSPRANIRGAANITGGGPWGKFGELLPIGIGAMLDSMPTPAPALLKGQELSFYQAARTLSDWEGYSTLHGGCGMLVVAETAEDADIITAKAADWGITASIVGETTFSLASLVEIKSRFLQKPGHVLRSDQPE